MQEVLHKRENGKIPKTIIVAQTGGPSAVINCTLAGIVSRCQENQVKVLGLVNAFEGLLAGNIVDLSGLDAETIQRLYSTPGAFLGSSRLQLTASILKKIPYLIKKLGGEGLLLIGGNGTMFAAHIISEAAKMENTALQVLGVPKTIDNDIVGLERTPGFGSAAKYVAQAVRDIGIDLEAMKTFEQVRIIEVMGRSVGWLAAAAGLAKNHPAASPHLIYLPEQPFDENEFISEIKRAYEKYGFVVAVVGEGVKYQDGTPVGASPFAELDNGSRIYGGAANYLADLVNNRLDVRARAQDLTMAQRCFKLSRSPVDEKEAYTIGQLAVNAFLDGCDDSMVCYGMSEDTYSLLPLSDVGGKEKSVPTAYYDKHTKQVTPAFLEWLRLAVGDWDYSYLTLRDIGYERPR
ncbi:diphosphate--fructose-6-phosphate 1-phosphotransferase [Sporomusa acidovorans]|uniref:Pyrophosphate--fructose 6-phosphate 1-phosphotransferase n=1 Tax=Sporomusa acidovorans (strain ATCC 49682 / DSM 3132 / Mol) TaxID=1123286 RepID=A0ABZ3J7K1_SPOA4|nr:diphosphate--fructose-6-phosphate 1-phosphotransferase [Sporomusa acidovorans]OZC21265.1 6-phosphofructokinase [Sporomusa acidovorans DSM 3132]SDE66412.1 6-phosphofructokinase 1 [Sporomusa acidovorans]